MSTTFQLRNIRGWCYVMFNENDKKIKRGMKLGIDWRKNAHEEWSVSHLPIASSERMCKNRHRRELLPPRFSSRDLKRNIRRVSTDKNNTKSSFALWNRREYSPIDSLSCNNKYDRPSFCLFSRPISALSSSWEITTTNLITFAWQRWFACLS